MWFTLGNWIIKNRVSLLFALLLTTCVMGYFASKVELSYEFARAIPIDNPKYKEYQLFRQRFGDDGGLMVIGVETKDYYSVKNIKIIDYI